MLESRPTLTTISLLDGAFVNDLFPSVDDLIEHILPCIDKHAGGANETTRERRRAMVMFFHRHMLFSASQMPSMDVMIEDICVLTILFGKSLDHAGHDDKSDRDSLDAIEIRLVASMRSLGKTIKQLSKNRTGPWTARETARCFDTLREVFDWNNDENVRAYVYAMAQEALKDGLLGKERSNLLDAVKHCAEQHIRNEQFSE